MNGLLEKLLTLPELRELAAEVHKTRCCAAVTGLSPVHRAMVAAALAEETKRPLLLLCADEKECARQAADVQVLLGVEPVRLPEIGGRSAPFVQEAFSGDKADLEQIDGRKAAVAAQDIHAVEHLQRILRLKAGQQQL